VHRHEVAAAAALAAVGRAAAIRSMAASSWAAVTNHASKGLGGRYTPGVEHRVEERLISPRLGGLGLREVRDRRLAEEHREQVAGVLHPMRNPLRGKGFRGQPADRGRRGVQALVHAGRAVAQRCQPGGNGHGITRQRPGLIDRSGRGEVGHHLRPSAEGRRGQPAAHNFAEGEQVRGDGFQAVPARRRDAESGHHLVADQQRTVARRDSAQAGVEPGLRGHRAHVAGRRLGDHAGDVLALRREHGLDGGEVVVGQDDRLGGLRTGHAGRIGQPERRHAGTGGGEAGRPRGRGSSRRTSPRAGVR